MSTETMEDHDVIPMTPSFEVGVSEDEMHGAAEPCEHELARAEGEGMTGVTVEIPVEPDVDPAAHAKSVESALRYLFRVQRDLEAAQADHALKAEVAKDAKAEVEGLKTALQTATKKLQSVVEETEPNPDKFPLFDKPNPAKAEIDAMFAKPDVIKPLPADTFEEFTRRAAEAKMLQSLRFGTDKQHETILGLFDASGVDTVGQLARYTTQHNGLMGMKSDSAKMTEARAELIGERLNAVYLGLQGQWESSRDGNSEGDDK